ncbi:hypothetical protein BKA65DRAFT_165726 [Rhexocercosporidium sp. MPI-PUGE-AT-0058]|nr:hypothetical protein BKA65DRAFT_165726 [Rhexocercosporidium sp. MPI-PUGE-AT-0058]
MRGYPFHVAAFSGIAIIYLSLIAMACSCSSITRFFYALSSRLQSSSEKVGEHSHRTTSQSSIDMLDSVFLLVLRFRRMVTLFIEDRSE